MNMYFIREERGCVSVCVYVCTDERGTDYSCCCTQCTDASSVVVHSIVVLIEYDVS